MGNLHHPSHVLEVSVRVMEEDVLLVMVRLVTVASVFVAPGESIGFTLW